MDYAALHTEITTDPLAVGYASPLAAMNDNAVAALLNAVTGVGAATITLLSLSHDALATLIAPVTMNLSIASTILQTKWAPMLTLIGGISSFQTTPQNMGMLNALSADFPTQLPANAITAATTRIGSRAEILFGVNTIIDWQYVAVAMGRMS